MSNVEKMANVEQLANAKREKLINAQTEVFIRLKLDGKSINEERKAILDKIEANGIDRKAFKDMAKLREVEEDKRIQYEVSRKIIAKAYGWPEQIEMFASDGDKLTDEDEAMPDPIAAKIQEIWGDEDHVDNRDAPEESDLGSFSRAEHDEQAALSARG